MRSIHDGLNQDEDMLVLKIKDTDLTMLSKRQKEL